MLVFRGKVSDFRQALMHMRKLGDVRLADSYVRAQHQLNKHQLIKFGGDDDGGIMAAVGYSARRVA